MAGRRMLIFDIEANGLHPDRVWCIAILDQGEMHVYGPNQIQKGLEHLAKGDILVGHNVLGYDLPVLNKLYGFSYRCHSVKDTLVLSYLLNPNRGYHSLAEWGNVLGIKKMPDLDWSTFSSEMLTRCARDVEITAKILKKLQEEAAGWDWSLASRIEHGIAYWHQKQVENGVLFDTDRAVALLKELDNEIKPCIEEIRRHLPYIVKPSTMIHAPFRKDGKLRHHVHQLYADDPSVVVGPFCRVDIQEPNANSVEQIKAVLEKKGWEPDEWNFKDGKKTSPKITESSLKDMGSLGEAISRLMLLRHRRNMIQSDRGGGFLSLIREDGRIEADAITCGAISGRYRHVGVANLPRVSTPYGREIRSLFIVPKGKLMFGWDLAGIENRIVAHYLAPYDKGAFIEEVTNGDFHQRTADDLGLTRDEAKTFRYMILYGAKPTKIASTLGWPKKKASEIYKMFWEKEKALARLQYDIEYAYRTRGFLKGIDGRKLLPRKDHALLNLLIQAAATSVFKLAVIRMNELLTEKGIDYKQLIAYHDEIQLEIPDDKEIANEVAEIVRESVDYAAKELNVRCPLDFDWRIGYNWAETH